MKREERFFGNCTIISTQINLTRRDKKEKYEFHCERWLASDEDDEEIVRELPAESHLIKKPLEGKF